MHSIILSWIPTFMGMLLCFIISFSPAHAATSLPFTVNLSENVTVTGVPRVAVDVGGVTRYATYTSGTGTSALTFTYDAVLGDVDLDGVALTSPIDLNGGTIKDAAGNDATLTFALPNTSGINVNYPSLGMDFVYDADGRYTLNGTVYNDLPAFLTAAGGTFTRTSIGTYFGASGVLQNAASGVPRFDHDPVTLAAKGILIEEARTNKLLSSQQIQISGGDWAESNSTLTSTAIASPIQSASAYSISETTSNTTHYFRSRVYTLSDVDNTFSAFVKANGRAIIGFITNSNGITTNCIFNLSTGTVSSLGSYLRASIIPLQNGWWRISATYNPSAGSGLSTWMGLQLYDDGSNNVYVGDTTKGIYMTGIQWEQGSFPTSYIPTTSAAVTRQADSLTMPTGGWYNSTASTLYSEYSSDAIVGYSTRIASLNEPTSTNVFQLADAAAGFIINQKAVGGFIFNTVGPAYSVGTTYKIAGSLDALSNPLAVNNVLYSSANAGLPTGMTRLQVGYQGASSYLNGRIKTLKYYPARVSDTQLQLLTQ